MSDLRDSGNVEQDAQLILFPYRPEYYGITEDDPRINDRCAGLYYCKAKKITNGSEN